MDYMESEINKIFEDDDILVLDKPSGLIVNRSITAKSGTLQDLLEKSYEFDVEEGEEETGDFTERSGIVHRLDKDTSGVLVVAKNKKSFDNLLSQFKERKAIKEYLAVLCGNVRDEVIEIDAPLKRNPKSPLKFAVVETGKEAFTRLERIKNINLNGKDYTLMKVLPKTGRTHQIRVHAAAMGYPVAGDSIYCSRILLESSLNQFGRLMLHAQKLGFYHPKTGNFIEFTSQTPAEFSL
jgi:23S rRNA pseudouridine1911/1915/1917 synthase